MKIRLSVKMIGVLFLLSCILFSGLTIFTFYNRKKDLLEYFTERAKATTHSLEISSIGADSIQDKNKLLTNIFKNMWADPEITNINFSLLEGEKLTTYVSSDSNKINQNADEDNVNSFAKNILISKIIRTDSSEILKVITPISVSEKKVGTIQVDFSLMGINNRIKSSINTLILGYIIMIFLFLISVFIFFHLLVIRPILEINKGVEAITDNNFDYRVNLKSNDEISNLAKVFNRMAEELKVFQAKTKARTKELEKEVQKRTMELKAEKGSLEDKVKQRTAELENLKNELEKNVNERTRIVEGKLKELEQVNKLMVGRELRMAELKKENEKLKKRLEKKV